MQQLVFDISRAAFRDDTKTTLGHLALNRLIGRTSFSRLLLGRKGVGKSTLLNELQNQCKVSFPDITCIYKTYGGELTVTLVEHIVNELHLAPQNVMKPHLDASERVGQLEQELTATNTFIFLAVDEIQHVFQDRTDRGRQIIAEIAAIGDSRGGRIHCIITGSSRHLRQLCFAKLSEEHTAKFPAYSAMDMNSTKVTARWIYPFLDANTFQEAVEMLSLEPHFLDGIRLAELYKNTGGVPRLMDAALNNPASTPDRYTLSAKGNDFAQDNATGVSFLLYCLFQMLYGDDRQGARLEDVAHWMRCVPLAALLPLWQDRCKEHRIPFTSDLIMSVVYGMADKGTIRYLHQQGQVGLGSPLIYEQLRSLHRCASDPAISSGQTEL
eukprot:TRINITY_DN5781_c0_g1_i1.p1 TRINITY_DN5781_c0_g1~~TRINITY_DN5781_c0_g1_i1.p1  ORF type:complete len:383 (-),score=52.34 TRINITY_DN5781_c0_g1_i1:199-1347(-)